MTLAFDQKRCFIPTSCRSASFEQKRLILYFTYSAAQRRPIMIIEKHQLEGRYRKLFFCLSAILFENDLQGINFGTNDDEYEPEVSTILPRLPEAQTIDDVQRIVYEEFGRWFGHPGDYHDYGVVAKEIWAAWCTYINGMS